MDTESHQQAAYDEVLKKIGRNLLMFQQAEQILKLLLTWGSFRMTPDKPVDFEEMADVWNKQTMGQLKSEYLARHCSQNENLLADFNPESPGMAMTFTFGDSAESAGQRRTAIDMLVTERNELVHHLFLKLDRNSPESCREISGYLDAQREMCLPAVQQLKDDCKHTREMMVEMVAFLMSSEGKKELRIGPIQQCPLITNLAAIAAQNPDPKAWTRLKSAISRLQDFPCEKINDLVTQFGRKSLTELLAASGMFELGDEELKNGSHRTLYRLKSGSTAAHSQP